MLSKDEISVDFGFAKNSMGLYGQRTIYYKDYKINKPIDEKVFKGRRKLKGLNLLLIVQVFGTRIDMFRLPISEKGTYTTIDSIKKIPAFKRSMNLVMLFTTGFLNLGKIEIGPAESFFSINPVEGSRLRFGGRTYH